MPYEFTQAGLDRQAEVIRFMDEHIYPNETEFYRQYHAGGDHSYPPILDELKAEARKRGLWNLFLPHLREGDPGTKLSNLDYAPISEQLGKVTFSSEVLNCNAPDTGNMEILNMFGNEGLRRTWLTPLLNGEVRSAFAMKEPAVGRSSKAMRRSNSAGERVAPAAPEIWTAWVFSAPQSDRTRWTGVPNGYS